MAHESVRSSWQPWHTSSVDSCHNQAVMSLGQAAAAYDAYNRTAPYEGKVVLQDLYNEPYNSAPIGHYDARMLNVNYHPNHYV